jgi:hypothetical protein
MDECGGSLWRCFGRAPTPTVSDDAHQWVDQKWIPFGVKGVMENTEVWGVPNTIRKTIFEGCTLMGD